MNADLPAVIAVDGPAASGKGTVAAGVAAALGFHYLDSGSLYRLVALRALRTGTPLAAAPELARLAAGLEATFRNGAIVLEGQDVTKAIRAEPVSVAASQVAGSSTLPTTGTTPSSSAAFFARSPSNSTPTTCAPSARNSVAAAQPMPEPTPVMIAVLPSSRAIGRM